MKKKALIVLVVTVVMALLLSACKMPLSTGPKTTPTTAGELPFPVTTQSNLVNQMLFATQTAIAAGGGTPAEGTQAAGGGTQEVQGTPGPNESGGGAPAAGTQEAGGGAPTEQAGGGGAPSDQTGGGAPTEQASGGGAPAGSDQTGGGAPAQPAPQPTYQLPPEPARPATYTLQKGEYPYCIARRYNIDPAALLSANNLGTNSQVSIGTTLTLPASSTWNSGTRALRAHPTTYTVRQGDTLNSVACLFGNVYPEFIAAANGLQAGAALTPGQTINIP